MSEAELFYRLSEDRLRQRALWAGGAIALSVLMPYEVIDNQPQFIWQLFAELPPSGVIAGLMPLATGAVIIAARRWCARSASLAIAVIAALCAHAVVHRLGADASAWGLLPLPASFMGRTGLALAALGATAAGANLAFRPATRAPSRWLLIGALLCALVFYLLPGRGEAPGTMVWRMLAVLGDMPTLRFQLGILTVAVVALWPAILALIGLWHLRRPPARSFSGISMAALFGFPLILMMLLFSWYVRSSPGSALFGAFGAALEISAVLALFAAAAEALGDAVFSGERDVPMPDGWPAKKTAALAGAAVIAVAGLQWWLARPPDKGVAWTLSAATADGDRLFGELVVSWSDARYVWDRQVREDSSASLLLEVKKRGRDMVEAGQAIDPALGAALDALASAAWRLDTSSRAWYRLVADVNGAARDASLPYYLDPQVSIRKTKDGLERSFVVDSYRVEQVHRWQVDGAPHATLFVRGFGTLRGGHALGLLGFSRDVQRFALVVVEAGEAHVAELLAMAAADPPRCGEAFDSDADRVSLRCGEQLGAMVSDVGRATDAVLAKVERHELQHQIDGPLLRIARPVLRKLAGYADETQERVNRELSAYVAQLSADSPLPKLGLVIPLRFALLQDRGIYHHAAVLMFEAMAGTEIRDARGRVQPARLGEVFDGLMALDDDALRARAAEVWQELFGDPLPRVERMDG